MAVESTTSRGQPARESRVLHPSPAHPAAGDPSALTRGAGGVVGHLDAIAQGVATGAATAVVRRTHQASRDAVEGARLLQGAPPRPGGMPLHGARLGQGPDEALRAVVSLADARTVARPAAAARRASTVARVVVPLAIALGVADVGLSMRADGGFGRESQRAVGRVGGGAGGAAAGALLGALLIPVPGVGSAIGAVAGGLFGSHVGERVARPVASFVSDAASAVASLFD